MNRTTPENWSPPDGSNLLPYGRHTIDEADIAAVVEILRSDWLTTGPAVERFEDAMAAYTSAPFAVALSSGTAALHAAMYAAGVGPGDEVIVPPITFVATANAVVFQGATPIFADVHRDTLLLDPAAVEARITSQTRAILAVDYAGQPCEYARLRALAERYGLILVADACHSLGASYSGRPVGTLADLTVFSFHPVKHITTGEGGMVVTNRIEFRERMAAFRNHGIGTDHRQRAARGSWTYDMRDLGYNYRLTDFQCALGLSQLSKLPQWLARRRALASRYTQALDCISLVRRVGVRSDVEHAYHLYPVRVNFEAAGISRAQLFRRFHARGIRVNVHYIPVHLQPYYRNRFGTAPGLCPAAEQAYTELLTLPLFPAMTDEQVQDVVSVLSGSLARAAPRTARP